MGAGVSNATGLGGLTNGDVVREGANNLPKEFYIARAYARFMLPLGPQLTQVEACAGSDRRHGSRHAPGGQDRLAGGQR